MADDWTPIVPGRDYGEGIYTSSPGPAMSWGAILNFSIDMYGGVGGQILAQGGVTGMPSPFDGGTGSVIPGADGGSATPPNRDNELLNPNGLPVPSWTPHGSPNPNGISNLYAAAARQIASAAANAPHEVNSGLWGVPGYGWSNQWPVDPNRVDWYGHAQPAKADRYQTMPQKHHQGPAADPFFSIQPFVDPHDFIIMQSPYEFIDDYLPIIPIGDVVTFPGNPANDNNPTGPGGGPHNWDNYRQQALLSAAIARILSGNLGQDHFFGP